MRVLKWLQNNPNLISIIIGVGLVFIGDREMGYSFIKGGLG